MGIFSDLAAWQLILITLLLTHVTIVAVTIFLHRAQAHRAVQLATIPSHFFRFWLWLTTGMVTREWVAIHRKHHAKCETEEDPHSPQFKGINTVLWKGAFLYRKEALTDALGPDGMNQLRTACSEKMEQFNAMAERLYINWLQAVAQV